MKRAQLLKKTGLEEADFVRIHDAVAEIERNSSGEVATAIIAESSDYSFYELLVSVFAGAIVFAVLLPFNEAITNLLDMFLWDMNAWYLSAFYGIVTFFVIAVCFLLFNIPALDRLIIPSRVKSKAVYTRSLRHFIESGVYATKENTGILIFISLLEKEVRIVADAGIQAKIPQEHWDAYACQIAQGIKEKKLASSLLPVINSFAQPLTKHFPKRSDDADELTNDLVILEE